MILKPADAMKAFEKVGGGKALQMAKLSQLGLEVPPWFCVTTDAFDLFINEHRLEKQLILNGDLKTFSDAVSKLFLFLPLPAVLQKQIADALVLNNLHNTYVAVRSSGADEDSVDFSFAGQFSTFLFQKGIDDVCMSIKKCWASGFSERGLRYRLEHGIPLDNIRVAVVVQQMVNADSAGVAFSRHPARPSDAERLVINSVWGLGEGVVNGDLDADQFIVHRQKFEVEGSAVTKSQAYRQAARGGVEKVSLAPELRAMPSLTKDQATEVAKMAIEIEHKFGRPQDLEWAFENGKLFCLQARPITNFPPSGYYSGTMNGTKPTLWDNSNIIESYAGVTAPLTFTFASNAYQKVYRQFCDIVGIPQDVIESHDQCFRNMLGSVRGRVYYNLINWYKLVLLLPGASSNPEFMETMMGVKHALKPEVAALFDFVANPPSYSLRHNLWLMAVMSYRFLKIDSIVAQFQNHFQSVYHATRKVNFSRLSLPEQAQHYQMLDDKLLKRWHAPIINDCLCMVFFGLLKKLTSKWMNDESQSLQNDLLCGQGDIESTEPTKMLMRIAAKIDKGDPSFKQWFLSTAPETVWDELIHQDRSPEILAHMREFLDHYGFRCVNELKLEELDLHDDPTFALNAIAGYIKTNSYSTVSMEEREQAIRTKAEDAVSSHLRGWKKLVYFWVLKHARKAIQRRENLRFARTKVFGIIRHLFRAMGKNFATLGIIDHPDDIFYLTLDEVLGFIEGRSTTVHLNAIATERKKEHDEFRRTPAPPDRFLTYGTVGISSRYPQILADADLCRSKTRPDPDANTLVGTPCCPGIVTGVVRVVEGIHDAQGINGEILVTERTDPGWVPLYPSCSGLLIERGSLLSHSAVVARELGLPTIVGITGLTQKLKSGQKVHIDATKGIVRIIE